MKSRRFEDIPAELRRGWEPTDAGRAWVELLGPHVPEDVKRWTPDTDSGFLLSDPLALLAADNSFGAVIEQARADGVLEPALQALTSTYYLADVPHEGDCLMFFCDRGSETAEVVGWSHETGELYGPLAYDLPTVARVLEVAESNDAIERRATALRPALGRWVLESFPMSLFEDQLEDDGVWSRDGEWPAVEAPESSFPGIVSRAWWVAEALVGRVPTADQVGAQLDWTPDEALAVADFQDLPSSALYWLWRTFFLGEDDWHQATLARCKDSRSRLVRDAAAHAEAHGGAGVLAEVRARVLDVAAHLRNPFPDRVEIGPVAFVRDDRFAALDPAAVTPPVFPCEPGQGRNPWWPEQARVAIPHPDGRRWLVEGNLEHLRKGRHPSIPDRIDGLFEVDPTTGKGTLFCETGGEGTYTKWGEYLDEDRVLVINNGRLRLYERHPRGTGRGYLIDQIPLGQERAVIVRSLDFIAGYGGVPRWGDNGWETRAERITCARLVDGRLRATASVELALAHLVDRDGTLVGCNADHTAGYCVEGLTATAQPERIALAASAFVVPEKVWRAGPNAVLDSLGPMDVSVQSAAGLCLINKLETDPPGARRAYVGNAGGIQPTEPVLDIVGYALISPTEGCVTTRSAAFRVDLETGVATRLFELPEEGSVEVLCGGFVVLAAGELVALSAGGDELARVRVGDGAQLLAPIHGGAAVAMKTAASPLVLLALDAAGLRLLGAVRADGELAGVVYHVHAQPQWHHRLVGKTPDGRLLGLRGVHAAVADPEYGARIAGSWPDPLWTAAPEIQRY